MAKHMSTPKHLNNDVVHVVMPDTQTKYGVPFDHIDWFVKYVIEKFEGRPNVKIIMLGDWYDMPSLSSYDRKGGKLMEGRRYTTDIRYGNQAWQKLKPLEEAAARNGWELHFFMGNHEHRITRASEQDAQLEGLVTLDDLDVVREGVWKVHPFLKVVFLDGVAYSHYFVNRMSGRPLAGQSMDARIKTIGHSFTMGHQQGRWYGSRETLRGVHQGLVVGSFYLHDEDYLGYQGNNHWRGIVICYDVRQGDYDPKFVSLNSLCKRYTGRTLGVFKGRH